jgi:hypothetical protein
MPPIPEVRNPYQDLLKKLTLYRWVRAVQGFQKRNSTGQYNLVVTNDKSIAGHLKEYPPGTVATELDPVGETAWYIENRDLIRSLGGEDRFAVPTVTYSFDLTIADHSRVFSGRAGWRNCTQFDTGQREMATKILLKISQQWNILFKLTDPSTDLPNVVFGQCGYYSGHVFNIGDNVVCGQAITLTQDSSFGSLAYRGLPVTIHKPNPICSTPERDLTHEVLHALGFLHSHESYDGEPVFRACSGVMSDHPYGYENKSTVLGPIDIFLMDQAYGRRGGLPPNMTSPYEIIRQDDEIFVRLDSDSYCRALTLREVEFLSRFKDLQDGISSVMTIMFGFRAKPVTQIVVGFVLGISYGMLKKRPQNGATESDKSYKQHMLGIGMDVCIMGLRSRFPIAAIAFDVSSPTGSATRDMKKKKNLTREDMQVLCIDASISFVFHAGISVIQYAIPLSTVTLIALYAAKEIADQEAKSPSKTWGEAVQNGCKSVANGVIGRIHVVRRLPSLLTKCYRDLCTLETIPHHGIAYMEEAERQPARLGAPSTALSRVTACLSGAKRTCEGYVARFVLGPNWGSDPEPKVKTI